jgi:hypothetical protein
MSTTDSKETTTAIQQTVTEPSMPSKSITDIIIQDHEEAKAMYEEYKKAATVDEKTKIRNHLIKVLVKHDECEQMFAYPLLKDKIEKAQAKEYFNKCLADHQEMRTLLHHVRYLDTKEDDIDAKMDNAMQTVFYHMEFEEKEVLPLMSQYLTQEELKKAGRDFEEHKPKALTRLHPDAPASGLPAFAANIVLRPFDAIRNFMEGENKD